MIALSLHQDEAQALKSLLDLILTNEAASAAVFADGSQRRKVKRASMKLQWASSISQPKPKPS